MSDDVGLASYILVGVFVVLSAFFSGSEAALLSVQRVRIQAMLEHRAPGARRVARLIERPERLLPPILLGNNLVNTAAAAIATTIAIALIDDENTAVLVATVAVTAILLIFGETIPKTVGARAPERASIIVAIPIQAISFVLKPISVLLQFVGTLVASAIGGERAAVTEAEIKAMVSLGRQEGELEHGEAEMIHRVFEFGDRRVREVMTPRPEIVWVNNDATVSDFLRLYGEHSHTRFPVRDTSNGDVLGLLSVKDVVRSMAAGAALDDRAVGELRQVHFVPETKQVRDLLGEMQEARYQLAMVADEFGDIAGLVTLKRLTEGIVGPTTGDDEQAATQEVIAVMDDTFEIDGGFAVSEANDRLGLQLPEGNYETIAGLVLDVLGRVPKEGDQVIVDGHALQVVEMRGVRIARVTVRRPPTSPEE